MLITGTSLSYCAKRCSVINTNIDARKWEVTVHSVTSNALRDAQKSCIRMISRCNSRVFCELCSQKTPRGMLPVNSNNGKPLRATSVESVLPCFMGRIKVKDKK